MLGNIWNAKCYGKLYGTNGTLTHSSVTGKMTGTSVIPDFLAHMLLYL